MELITSRDPDAARRFDSLYAGVERARDLLELERAGAPEQDENLRVACERLDEWLLKNYARYIA